MSCVEKHSGITPKDLQGVYNADFSSYMLQLTQNSNNSNPYMMDFAKQLFSNVKVTMTFNGDSLFMEAEGSTIDLMQTLANSTSEGGILMAYQYEIRNDSILYTKEEDNEFKEFGVFRKIDDRCDSLIMKTEEDDGSIGYLPLSRKK